MSFCTNCGNRVGDNDSFCSKCGAVVEKGAIQQPIEEENVAYTKAANLFRGIEGVGGKLVVTNKRLIFKPHMINIQSEQEEIPFERISSVTARNTAGLIPNGMSVFTKEGKEYKFVLWNRTELINYINNKIKR